MKTKILFLTLLITTVSLFSWEQIYSINDYNLALEDIALSTDGNYFVSSYVCNFRGFARFNQGCVIKITAEGDTLWSKRYSIDEYTNFHSLQALSDGGFIVVGETWEIWDTLAGSSYGSLSNIILVRCDSEGETLWTRTFPSDFCDRGLLIKTTTDDGFIIAGTRHNSEMSERYFRILRTDPLGNELWSRQYIYGIESEPNFIVNYPNGDIVVGGALKDEILTAFMFRTDSLGTPIWNRAYEEFTNPPIPDIRQSAFSDGFLNHDEQIVACGYRSYPGDTLGIIQAIFENDGTLRDYNLFHGVGGACIIQFKTDNYLLAGNNGGGGIYTLCLDTFGDSLWTEAFAYHDSIFRTFGAVRIIRSGTGGYLIGGISINLVVWAYPAYVKNDIYIVGLDSTFTISENQILPTDISIKVFPNPFNSAVSISAPEDASVEIFDIEGRKIGELPGGTQVWKPEPSIGSGIYLVRATVGEQEITKRVVHLK